MSTINSLFLRILQMVKRREIIKFIIIKISLTTTHINHEEALKFIQVLGKDAHEYKGRTRPKLLAETLGKDKGELVWWYEGYKDVYVESKGRWKRERYYPVKPKNLNLDEYKKLLLRKLKDSLEITGIHTTALERELLKSNSNSDFSLVELRR